MNTRTFAAATVLLLSAFVGNASAAGAVNAATARLAAADCDVPNYRNSWQDDEVQGAVKLAVLVDADGNVQETKVISSSGFASLLLREIEREGGDNNHQEDYELCGHNVNCAYRTRKSTANGMRTGAPRSTSPRVGCGAAVRDVFSATKSEPCVGPHFLVSLTGKAHSDRFKR